MRKFLFLFAFMLLWSTSALAQVDDPVITAANADSVHEVARIWRGTISDIAVSSDESELAVAAMTGVYVYNLKDRNAAVTHFSTDDIPLRSIAFDSTGTNIAAGTVDGQVYIFNTYTGEHRATIQASTAKINAVAFTYSPFSVLAASDDHVISVWSMQDFSREWTMTGHSYPVQQLELADEGKYVVSADSKSIRIWETGSFTQNSVIDANSDFVRAIAFNPARPLHMAAAMTSAGLIIDGDLSALGGDVTVAQDEPVDMLAFSGDGRYLALGRDGLITLCDPDSGQPIRELKPDGYLYALRFSADGARLYSASNGYIAVWDTATGKRLETIDDQFGMVGSLSYSPDGRLLAAGNYLNTSVTVFNTATLEQVAELQSGETGVINAVTFSPDSKLLATAGSVDDDAITLWDTTTFKPVKQLSGHSEPVRMLSFAPNSTALFSVASDVNSSDSEATPAVDGKVGLLWDIATGTVIHEMRPGGWRERLERPVFARWHDRRDRQRRQIHPFLESGHGRKDRRGTGCDYALRYGDECD